MGKTLVLALARLSGSITAERPVWRRRIWSCEKLSSEKADSRRLSALNERLRC